MHKYGFPHRPFPFDLEVICGIREEQFPLEALADFARLGAWVTSPLDSMRVEWAAKTAVAGAIRDTLKGRNDEVFPEDIEPFLANVQEAHFPLKTVAFGLLRMPGLKYWEEDHSELASRAETAIVIAEMLLKLDRHAPTGIRASMNRAIQHASFPSAFSDGVSRQTAKVIWEEYGACSAFLVGERWLDMPDLDSETRELLKELMFLSPSRADFFFFFQLFRAGGILRSFLSHVHYLQNELSLILDRTGATGVPFVEFPSSIPPIPLDIPIFSEQDLRRLNDYSSRD